MTTRPAPRRRILTADRLYTAAFVVGVMLVPHLILGTIGQWSDKPFVLHALLALFLAGCGWKATVTAAVETVEEAARGRKNKGKKQLKELTDDQRFEQITSQLRDDDTAA